MGCTSEECKCVRWIREGNSGKDIIRSFWTFSPASASHSAVSLWLFFFFKKNTREKNRDCFLSWCGLGRLKFFEKKKLKCFSRHWGHFVLGERGANLVLHLDFVVVTLFMHTQQAMLELWWSVGIFLFIGNSKETNIFTELEPDIYSCAGPGKSIWREHRIDELSDNEENDEASDYEEYESDEYDWEYSDGEYNSEDDEYHWEDSDGEDDSEYSDDENDEEDADDIVAGNNDTSEAAKDRGKKKKQGHKKKEVCKHVRFVLREGLAFLSFCCTTSSATPSASCVFCSFFFRHKTPFLNRGGRSLSDDHGGHRRISAARSSFFWHAASSWQQIGHFSHMRNVSASPDFSTLSHSFILILWPLSSFVKTWITNKIFLQEVNDAETLPVEDLLDNFRNSPLNFISVISLGSAKPILDRGHQEWLFFSLGGLLYALTIFFNPSLPLLHNNIGSFLAADTPHRRTYFLGCAYCCCSGHSCGTAAPNSRHSSFFLFGVLFHYPRIRSPSFSATRSHAVSLTFFLLQYNQKLYNNADPFDNTFFFIFLVFLVVYFLLGVLYLFAFYLDLPYLVYGNKWACVFPFCVVRVWIPKPSREFLVDFLGLRLIVLCRPWFKCDSDNPPSAPRFWIRFVEGYFMRP